MVEASITASIAAIITLAFVLKDRRINEMGRRPIKLCFEAGAVAQTTHFVKAVSCCQSSVQGH